MRRIHSVVIVLALTEPLLISKFENASGTRGARRVEATNCQGIVHADAESLRNQVANGVPQRCANQNECDAARGCGA
jgi:hypothetical protein